MGRGSTDVNGLTAAKKIVRKSVFCVDNISPAIDVDKLRGFVSIMNINVISCFEVKPRRQHHETGPILDCKTTTKQPSCTTMEQNQRLPVCAFPVTGCDTRFVVVSYNLHGFNQGYSGIKEMINVISLDVIMIQEHWLLSSNMSKLNEISCEYYVFGSSPMDSVVGTGPLYGRPYGGVAMLIKKRLMPLTVNVFTADRIIAVKIADFY